MKVFLPRFLIFTGACALLLFGWNACSSPQYHDSFSWFIFSFFACSTLLVHALLLKAAADENPKAFVNRFMGLTGLKLFAYLLFLLVVFLLNRDHARMMALYFLSMYLVFTTFEIASLYRKLRK